MELAQLVDAAAKGDQRAWVRLVARISPRLSRWFALRLPGFERELLVQDTLIVIWNKLHDFELRSEAAFNSWMYKIANFVALAALRQAEQDRNRKQQLRQVIRSPSKQLTSIVRRGERIEMVMREVENLPASYRLAIENLVDGGDAKTLAKRAGVEYSSARKQLSRALGRLRERLSSTTPTP